MGTTGWVCPMLSLLLRRRHGDGTGQQIDLGAVLDHMAGSGAQAEGENSGEGFTPNPSPITGSGSERTNGPGDLFWLLPKAKAVGHSQKGREEEHPLGHGSKSSTSDPGSGGQKTLVNTEQGKPSPGRNVLTGQKDMGILQSGQAHSLTMNGEVLSTLVGGQTRDRRSERPQSFENLPGRARRVAQLLTLSGSPRWAPSRRR